MHISHCVPDRIEITAFSLARRKHIINFSTRFKISATVARAATLNFDPLIPVLTCSSKPIAVRKIQYALLDNAFMSNQTE